MTQKQIQHFWDKVQINTDGVSCWNWKAATFHDGYGCYSIPGKTWRAHRLAYTLTNADIPNGLHCLHKCDNPLCCNPDHLWLGTNRDNIRDKVSKHRQNKGSTHFYRLHPELILKGEDHGCAKLTKDQVLSIRKERKSGTMYKEIAMKYNVTPVCVRYACIGKTWSHI